MCVCARVCVCVFGRGVCVCVQESLVMDILSSNKIAFHTAPRKQIWENIIVLFGNSGAYRTTPRCSF